ncbi:MAG: SHD1 domain-containing protein [Pirellulales bacterium]
MPQRCLFALSLVGAIVWSTAGVPTTLLAAGGNDTFKPGDPVEYIDFFGDPQTGRVRQVTSIGKIWVDVDGGGIDAVDAEDLRRPAAAADNPFASDEEKAKLAEMRTWQDSTGRFKVTAKLLRVEDEAVVLEREDGREVTVPLNKLSDTDRRFLAGDKTASNDEVGITPTDLGRAQLVDLSTTSPWGYTPDPEPAPASASASDAQHANGRIRFTLGQPLDIFERMVHLIIAPDQKRAFAITSHESPTLKDGYQSRVFACDLEKGAVDQVGYFATGQLPVDVSPDGKWIVAHSSSFGFGEKATASLYALSGENADPLARWEPYRRDRGSRHEADIRWMRFVDDNHVLMVNEGEQVSLWSVPELEPVWAVDIDRFSHVREVVPEFSPGGKVVALPNPEGIALVEVLTGRKLGQIEVDDLSPFSVRFGFDPTGRKLAVIENSRCRVWHLDPPELIRDFAISQNIGTGEVHWVDEDRLLVDGRYLIDVNLRIWLWDYEHQSSKVEVRGNKVWAVVAPTPVDPWVMGSQLIPHQAALDVAAVLDPDDLLVVEPGAAMAVEVDLDLPPQQRRQIESAIVQNVESSGFRIDPTSPIKVVGDMSTGRAEEITYSDHGGLLRGRGTTQHVVAPNTVQLTIYYNDQPIWRYSNTKRAPHLLTLQEGETREQALDREMEQDPSVLAHVRIPTHIALGGADRPYGSTSGRYDKAGDRASTKRSTPPSSSRRRLPGATPSRPPTTRGDNSAKDV